jgi:hypothetical protein
MFKKKILLPQTESEFNNLINLLVKKYGLPDWNHAASVVATRITHLPPDQAYSTLEYLGGAVRKNIAYQIAQSRGQHVAHKSQVDAIVAELRSNPHNQQARDELEKAKNAGSAYARDALEKLGLDFDKAEDTAPAVPSGQA